MSDTDATQARQDVAADVDEILENFINANMLSMPYDVYVELFDAVAGLGAEIENLQSDNAKLRELCADMWRLIEDLDATPYVTERQGNNPAVTWLDEDWSVHESCKKRMRELGVEVGE